MACLVKNRGGSPTYPPSHLCLLSPYLQNSWRISHLSIHLLTNWEHRWFQSFRFSATLRNETKQQQLLECGTQGCDNTFASDFCLSTSLPPPAYFLVFTGRRPTAGSGDAIWGQTSHHPSAVSVGWDAYGQQVFEGPCSASPHSEGLPTMLESCFVLDLPNGGHMTPSPRPHSLFLCRAHS